MEKDLVEPIVEWLSRGYSSKENIKKLAQNYGYSEEEFEKAYAMAQRRISGEVDASFEKDIQTKKRKKRITVLTITFLFLLLLSLIGYFTYTKLFLSDTLF